MSRSIEMQEELRLLLDEQSQSSQQQTFLGINQTELGKQEQRMRRIRELFADFLALLHDNTLSSDTHSHDCPHCSAARSSLSGETMDEKLGVTLAGTVEKIIQRPGEVEKAQISVEGADPRYDEIRIENSIQSPNGNEVRLKAGAEVEVTVEAVEAKENAVTKSCSLPDFVAVNPMSLECPRCKAEGGLSCETNDSDPEPVHLERIAAALKIDVAEKKVRALNSTLSGI